MTIRNLYLRVKNNSLNNRKVVIEYDDGSLIGALGPNHIRDLYMKPFIKLKLKRII